MTKTSPREITDQLKRILGRHRRDRAELIRILREVEEHFGYLPREAMLEVANFLEMSAATVYGVATFYNRFRFTPLGRHPIKACLGTACHMQGGPLVLEALERELDIKVGDITPEGEFSLDRVACVGCCVLAPVVVIGEDIHAKMTSFKVEEVLAAVKTDGQKGTPHR